MEAGGKEKDKNIASSTKRRSLRSTIILSQFHFVRSLKCEETFPQYKKLKSAGPHFPCSHPGDFVSGIDRAQDRGIN